MIMKLKYQRPGSKGAVELVKKKIWEAEQSSQYNNWTVGVRFLTKPRDFFLFHSVQIGSGAHPVSNPIEIGVSFSRGQRSRGVNLTTHLHIVPRIKMVELYFHSFIHLHDMLN
jgi:hypothetical protein